MSHKVKHTRVHDPVIRSWAGGNENLCLQKEFHGTFLAALLIKPKWKPPKWLPSGKQMNSSGTLGDEKELTVVT